MNAAIERIAATPVLLVALDFDGTLAPLVDSPRNARMIAPARLAMNRLQRLTATHVALVSGRALDDLKLVSEYIESSPWLLSGSHGAQIHLPAIFARHDQPEPSESVRAHIADVAALVASYDGVWVESKSFGFAVHTRLASSETAYEAHRTVQAYAHEALVNWRQRAGHDVLEFSERTEGKDAAIRVLRAAVGATAVVFAGDDDTDEDALASLEPDDLGIRVGEGDTSASLRMADALAVTGFLNDLAEAREGAGFSAEPPESS